MYIQAWRHRLPPADVGLPAGLSRRTRGLRREELAALAGISVDYLVRLEQGRDRNPSAAVVASLAEALRLTEEERAHLGHLVAAAPDLGSVRELAATVDVPGRQPRSHA